MKNKKYKLINNYPGHEIGDIALYMPEISEELFVWEKPINPNLIKSGLEFETIPRNFQPDVTIEWFKEINDNIIFTEDGFEVKKDKRVYWIGRDNKKMPWYYFGDKYILEPITLHVPLFLKTNTHKIFHFKHNALAYIRNNSDPLFITEDGIPYYGGDDSYSISKDFKVYYSTFNAATFHKDIKTFSTKKLAEEYVFNNTPCLSFVDIMEIERKWKANNFSFLETVLPIIEKKISFE